MAEGDQGQTVAPASSSAEAKLATEAYVAPAQTAAEKADKEAQRQQEAEQKKRTSEAKKEGGEELVESLTDRHTGEVVDSSTVAGLNARTDVSAGPPQGYSDDELVRIANRTSDPERALGHLRGGTKPEDLEDALKKKS